MREGKEENGWMIVMIKIKIKIRKKTPSTTSYNISKKVILLDPPLFFFNA